MKSATESLWKRVKVNVYVGYDVISSFTETAGDEIEVAADSVVKVVQMIGDDGERLRSSDIWTIARHPWPRWLPLHSVTCRLDPMT